MIQKLTHFFMSRTFWLVILLCLLCLAIWFLGPLFAFSDWRPLDPVFSRALLIIFLIAYVIGKYFWNGWRVRKTNQQFMQALSSAEPGAHADNPGLNDLGKNFKTAMALLRESIETTNRGLFYKLRQRFVYQLPWYVFIGAPGSGKTTALINSGLQFPLADTLGNESVKGVGGTRNCDWWFSENAVFIDTAGRYLTHESNLQQDKGEWLGFLGLLKKYRPRQPLNGAILTVSVTDLMTTNHQSREKHASIIRARLKELSKSLGISFPVYVLVTKADLIAGFSDYFANLQKEDREQVLGFTFPESVESRDGLVTSVKEEYEMVLHRLFAGLYDLMKTDQDISRRAHSFAFPQNLANCLPLLSEFVSRVFSTSELPGIELRGVYFTSGTQEGTPFDRALSSLGRRFGVTSDIRSYKSASVGRSYFLHDLVAKVILPEAHLAGKNRREEKKALWRGLTGHGLAFATFLLITALLVESYAKNGSYLQEVNRKTIYASERIKKISSSDAHSVIEYLPILNALCCLTDGKGYSVDQPPVGMRFGLFQGEKLDAAKSLSYTRALQATLLPLVSQRLHQLLVASNDRNMDAAYQALKFYLMLNQPEHYDYQQLRNFIEADFNAQFLQGISREQQAAFLFHLHNMFGLEPQVSPYPLDESLVLSKRRLLSGVPFAERAYQTIKWELQQKGGLVEPSFLSKGGPRSHFVFERHSGKPLSEGVSGLFTRDGYRQTFLPVLAQELEKITREEAWVLGDYASVSSRSFQSHTTDEAEQLVTRLYLQEYVRLWDSYLLDLRLISTQSISESVDVARILSAKDSPLLQLIENISVEFFLESDLGHKAITDARKVAAKKPSQLCESAIDLTSTFMSAGSPEYLVQDHFRELIEIAHGDNKANKTAALLKMFNELYMGLSNIDFSIRGGARVSEHSGLIIKVRADAQRFPPPVRNILEGLAGEGNRQMDNGIRGVLSSELDGAIGDFCSMAISNRYPFNRQSARDTTLADFSRMFGPAGLMDNFFNEHLRSITDTAGPNWVLKRPADVQLPISSFQQAARIREVFFPAGARQPVLNFEYKIVEMDARVNQLSVDFDGQLFQYAHGPQIPRSVNWPGPMGTNQIRIELGMNDSTRKSMIVEGPWAAMRLFDLGERRHLQPEKFIATMMVQGYKVVFEVTSNSVNNPFHLAALEGFRCPTKLASR